MGRGDEGAGGELYILFVQGWGGGGDLCGEWGVEYHLCWWGALV